MHRAFTVEPWPLWLVGPLLLALALGIHRIMESTVWRRGSPQELIVLLPWVALGAALASVAGGTFSLSLGWPLVDQWLGTRLWIKLPVLLAGALALGLGLRLVRGRLSPLSLGVGVLVAIPLVALGREILL